MGKLFDKSANPSDDSSDGAPASRKPAPLMQGLGSGLHDGLAALHQSRQAIENGSRQPVSFSVPGTPAQIVQPNLDYLAAERKRLAPTGAFYRG